MKLKPINQGWRNILNVHTVAIIELQQKFSSQNVFVLNRKVELYSMEWQDAVDLSQFIVSAAPFGGPIGKYIRLLLCCLTNKVVRFHFPALSCGKWSSPG